MNKFLTWFDGKKTIIGIIVGAIYSVLISLGYAPYSDVAWTMIIAYTGVAFKIGLNRDSACNNTAIIPVTLPKAQKYVPTSPVEPAETAQG